MIINEVKKRLKNFEDIDLSNTFIMKTSNVFNVENIEKANLIINLGITNNIRRINKFHEEVNRILPLNGYYVSCTETLIERKRRNKKKIIFGLKNLFLFVDFIYKRVFPKLPIVKVIYFGITGGRNRVLSDVESYGRLVSCGFDIIDSFEYENLLYIISKKKNKPKFDMSPSYGPLFKMRRVGKNGKIIYIYKLRTMYPYSEYLQSSLYALNKLNDDGDKIKNDLRVTSWGKFFRKFWIDELPQIYNLIIGDVSLVGVRAISKAKFDLYDDDLKIMRTKFKPGLVPPFYVDLPKNFKDFQNSERNYLIKKNKKPIKTDIEYFFRALINILFKGARSS